MVRNINPQSFSEFGYPASEKAQEKGTFEKAGEEIILELSNGYNPVWQCFQEVWIRCGSGSAVLSVSSDNHTFYHFYLDKSVCLKKGIFFCLAPFQQEATARLRSATPPVQVASRAVEENLKMDPKLRVGSIYTFFYQEKEQGFFFPSETHPMLELTYVDRGSLHSVADGQDLLLQQGDIVVYAPGQMHMQYSDIGVAPRFVTISFDLKSGDISQLYNRKMSAGQHVVQLLQRMLREQERMDEFSEGLILAHFSSLLLSLLRQCDAPAQQLQSSNSVHNENEIIRRAQQYITAHIRQKLSVPVVARNVDVSPSYLTALFHKNLQISPGEYIRRAKLQESKQMIREDHMNFTEIAQALQYSTVHHFSRQFKQKFGITPSEYAKSVR